MYLLLLIVSVVTDEAPGGDSSGRSLDIHTRLGRDIPRGVGLYMSSTSRLDFMAFSPGELPQNWGASLYAEALGFCLSVHPRRWTSKKYGCKH